tara:strand:- start:188 stop:727 length:540 start_codon:yes stop_codon:yes gene_type:complete
MVEPISATLTGIALARQGFELLKNAKEGVSDAQQIGQALTSIFEGHAQFNEKRYSKSAISFGDIASEEIEYRNMLEDLDELRVLINRRYGHGTFEKIKQEYQERVREQKEQEKLERQKQVRKWAKYREWFQTGAIIFILTVLLVVGLLIWKTYQDGQMELVIPTIYNASKSESDNYKRN